MKRPDRWAVAGALSLYTAAVVHYARQITVEKWDGIQAIENGLALFGIAPDKFHLNFTRPPLGWILTAPVAALAYRSGGPRAALAANHAQMAFLFGLTLYACYELFCRRFSKTASAALTALMALNPLAISYAPFGMYDIFSTLAAVPFLWAAYRFVEAPSARRWGWALLFYALGVLTRYQIAALVLVPLAFLGFSGKFKRLALSPLWLLPPAGYALCVLLGGLVDWAAGGPGLLGSLAQMDWSMRFVITHNFGRQAAGWDFYFLSLWRQLGPLTALAAFGAWRWLKRGRGPDLYLLLALLVPLGFMSFGGSWKEERYALALLLFLYAALGEGLEFALEKFRARRAWVLLALFALAPWGQTVTAWRVLRREPTLRAHAHWDLAETLDRAAPPGTCLDWEGGQAVFFDHLELAPQGVDILMLGPEILEFYSTRRISGSDFNGPVDCPASFVLEPRQATNAGGERWSGGPLLKVYENLPNGRKKERWEVFPYDLRPVGGTGNPPVNRLP